MSRLTLLDCRDLSFSYGDKPVLRNATLSVQMGQVVALLGPNGSGKSTLLRVLLGQLDASGNVLWNGRPLADWPARALARVVAYLPQAPAWEPQQTVGDVLRLGRAPYLHAFGLESSHDIDVIREVAQTLGLSELLSRRLESLSGGQRQRVFIGRCLAQEPQAMLLDEPNAFLDLRHQVELGSLLRELAHKRQMGILMASHDLNLAGQFADRLALLFDGSIIAVGPPTEVLDPALLERVYGVRMGRVDHGKHAQVFPIVGE